MRLLLDTHIYLWCLQNDQKHLTKDVYKLITDAEVVYVSSISIWEAAIKSKLGKLRANIPKLVEAITDSGFEELSFTATHAIIIDKLPLIHHDPFDRALIAQAICEPLWLLTADKQLKQYSELVKVI